MNLYNKIQIFFEEFDEIPNIGFVIPTKIETKKDLYSKYLYEIKKRSNNLINCIINFKPINENIIQNNAGIIYLLNELNVFVDNHNNNESYHIYDDLKKYTSEINIINFLYSLSIASKIYNLEYKYDLMDLESNMLKYSRKRLSGLIININSFISSIGINDWRDEKPRFSNSFNYQIDDYKIYEKICCIIDNYEELNLKK